MSTLGLLKRHRIYTVLLGFVMILMTVSYNLSSYSIGALILFFLIDKNLLKKIKKVNIKLYAPFLFYFCLLFLGMLYTENQDRGWKLISLSISVLLLPIVLLGENISRKRVSNLLKIYKFWLIVLALFLIFHKLFIAKGPLWTLTMFTLETQIGIHQLYFSQFYFMGVLIAGKQLMNNTSNSLLRIIELLFFVFFITVLGSFTAILLVIPVIVFILIHFLKNKSNLIKITFSVLFVVAAFALSQTTIVKTKIQKLDTIEFNFDENIKIHEEIKNDFGKVNTINLRVIKWYSALKIIKNNFWTGVGTGDGNDELLKQYRILNFKNGIDFKYNAHNQYLESTIKFGFLGLGSVILLLFTPLVISWRKRDFMLLFISIFLIGAYCFESMLERQHGVVFFSFFIPLLYVFNKKQ